MPTVYPDYRLWDQPDGTYEGYTLSTNNGIQTMNMTDDLLFRKDGSLSWTGEAPAGYWNIPSNTVVITNGNTLDISITAQDPYLQTTPFFYINGTIVNNGVFPAPQTAKYVKWNFKKYARISSAAKIINYPNNYFYTEGDARTQAGGHYLQCYGKIINSGRFHFAKGLSQYSARFINTRDGSLFITNKAFQYFASNSGSWLEYSTSSSSAKTILISRGGSTININNNISIPEVNAVDINDNAIQTSLWKIDSGTTLNINSGKTLTNNGIIGNDGNIENNGTTTNNGTIINNNIITDNGTFTNDGIILSNSVITDPSGNPVIPGGSGTNNYPGNEGTPDQIDIKSSFTLPDSLTFEVPNGKTLKIHDGVTFIV